MDRYFYIFLCVVLLCIWFIILFFRWDLKKKLLITGIIGGCTGILSEFWYFNDYWRPMSFLGKYTFLEDFLFGFALVGVSTTLYDVIYNQENLKKLPRRVTFTLYFFTGGILSLLFFNNMLKINSVLVSSFAFLACSALIILIRKDLLKPSLVSGLLMVILIFPIYFLLSLLMAGFIEKYWLLYHSPLGITVLGRIPLTELIWYFSWGCLGGILYEFTEGKIKVDRHHK